MNSIAFICCVATLRRSKRLKPKSFMLVAGEAGGDLLAAELVAAFPLLSVGDEVTSL
jgi:hypothetical protein